MLDCHCSIQYYDVAAFDKKLLPAAVFVSERQSS